MDAPTLKSYIRTVVDFPKPGVRFRDISPLLAAPDAFSTVIDQLQQRLLRHEVSGIVAVEARGFIFGAAVAAKMRLPIYLVRKAGKLPHHSARIEYALEYGTDVLEIHLPESDSAARYAIVDDVLATGGTAGAAARLLESSGVAVACCAFLMELNGLPGRETLQSYPVESLLAYELNE